MFLCARELAQQLRGLIALVEVSASATTWRPTILCNSRRSDALFWPHWSVHTCHALAYMQAKPLTHMQ